MTHVNDFEEDFDDSPITDSQVRELLSEDPSSLQFDQIIEMTAPSFPVPEYFQPIPPPPQEAQTLMNNIFKYQTEQMSIIEIMFQEQRQLLFNPSSQAYDKLVQEQCALKEKLDQELQLVQKLLETILLDPVTVQKIYTLRQDLSVQLYQLELLQLELQQFSQNIQNPANLVRLVIVKQPFPFILNKNKQIGEDDLQVQLLTGTNVKIQAVTPVRCALISDATRQGNKEGKPLDYEIQNISPQTRIAKFPLKFLSGTKRASANVKFGMQLQLADGVAATIESNVSSPFVIITNECQWESCAGILLKQEAFGVPPGSKHEISWNFFANALQHHFLRATRQDLNRPRRMLSIYDLTYFHQKFFDSKQNITQQDFDNFWDWFGKCMQKVRYQRHICHMWVEGLIYGFMSRDDVEKALIQHGPGTFFIRFSERHGGQFAIDYVGKKQGTIKHYLVQPNDTAAAKKTLPNFLSMHATFGCILVQDPNSPCPYFKREIKEHVLEQYSVKQPGTNPNGIEGYDDEVECD